jgi:2-dehydro-3-deoxygluconokinase
MNRVITFGEIMGRLAPEGHLRFRQAMPGRLNITFAGAESSVAASIAFLGGDAAFVTALPSHAIADACVADLKAMGVDTRHILRTAQGRMGLYYLESGINQRPAQVIYDRESSSVAVTPPDAYDWAAIFKGATWFVISGITPAISRNAAEVALVAVQEAKARGVRVVCDMNYRSKLWRWALELKPQELAARTMSGLLPLVDVFIGGREDAKALLGIEAREKGGEPELDIARQIVARFPGMSHVAMTLRDSISASHNKLGGVLYDARVDQSFFAPQTAGRYEPYQITNIVDRLGCGDAFTAGLVFALATPELASPQSAIAFAAAASCLAHSIEGDFNYNSRVEVEALVGGTTTGRINR